MVEGEKSAQTFRALQRFLKEEAGLALRFNVYGERNGFEIVDTALTQKDIASLKGLFASVGTNIDLDVVNNSSAFVTNIEGEDNLIQHVRDVYESKTLAFHR